jgi:flagellar biosynthesis/type III secretory pathway chaperone
MQKVIKDLEKILNEQVSVYSDMENHISQKKEVLIKGNLDELKNVDLEIGKLIQTINRLETQRIQVLSKKPGLINKPLSDVAELASSKEDKKSILTIKEKLAKLMLKIKKTNDINAELLAHSIKLVQHTATLIGNTLSPEGTAYNQNGKNYKNNSNTNSISSVVHNV